MSSKIETLNGHFVDPLNMDPADVRIEDIAHALSLQNRFNGYTSRPYSVAEHSVNVATLTAMRLDRLWGLSGWRKVCENPKHRITLRQALLHDATEAYLPDMTYPVKQHMPEFQAAEDRLWTVIAGVFQVPVEINATIKIIDKRLATTEKDYLLSNGSALEVWGDYRARFPAFEGRFDIIDRYEVKPSLARRRFLDFYNLVREA